MPRIIAHPIFSRDDRKELLRAARFLADKTATGEFVLCCSSVAAVRALLQLCCMLRAARFMADETATGERVRVILNI